VIFRASISLRHRGFGTCSYDFECKAADPTKTIADMHAITDAQAAPTYVAASRGIEITSALHGAANIYHVTGLDFSIAIPLLRASHDGDIGYTAVDAMIAGMEIGGSITFQDSAIASSAQKYQTLLAAAQGALAVTVKQSQGAAAKTVTIANVLFLSGDQSPSADGGYTEYTLPFVVNNSATTPLTFSGANKILTIA
jgi:hypothetical protein